jgi:hypothetical protein
MTIKYDTSINIDSFLLQRVRKYAKVFGLSKQEIIIKVLMHFIKRSRRCVFIKRRTVGYQVNNGNYKKLTLHLDSRELEILKQIRVVTLLSTSYVLFIAMDLFGDRLFTKAKKSKWTLKNFRKYYYWGNYPEYELYINKTLALSRYRFSFI